jgi:multiple sugar transport system substrate-binding protein
MADPIQVDAVSRRTVLKGLAGAAALVSIPAIMAACSSPAASTSASAPPAATSAASAPAASAGASTAVGSLSVGSYNSDPGPKKGMEDIDAAFKGDTGIEVALNTVDHNTFQEQINSYLQGKPDDVFTWFAGYRMQFFAQKGLATDISDV